MPAQTDLCGEHSVTPGTHLLHSEPMPASEPLHAHTTRQRRHAPDANGSAPEAVSNERKAEGPIGELRLAVAEEEAGLERGGEPTRLGRAVSDLKPEHRASTLLPKDIESLLEPA